MQDELGPAAQAAIEKVAKLIALAQDKGASQGEAENAMSLAQRILDQHNLDMALVDAHNGNKGGSKRDDKKAGGGLYKWQRRVWENTAKLNMCHYFSIKGLECKAEEARLAREQAKWEKRYSRRTFGARETAEDRRRSDPAFYEGREAGHSVNLDTQVGQNANARIK